MLIIKRNKTGLLALLVRMWHMVVAQILLLLLYIIRYSEEGRSVSVPGGGAMSISP